MAGTKPRERANRSKTSWRRGDRLRVSGKENRHRRNESLRKKWHNLGLGARVIAFSGMVTALGVIAGTIWSAASVIYSEPNLKDRFHGAVSKAITVNVDRFGAVDGEGVDWVFPSRVQLTKAQLRGSAYALYGAREAGAYMLNEGFVQLRVTSHRDQQIEITNVEAVDVARLPAASGTLIHINGAGEALASLLLNFNQAPPVVEAHRLNKSADVVNRLSEPDVDDGLYAIHPDIALKDGDTAILSIGVTSHRYAVSFRIRITYAVGGGKQETATVGVDAGPHGPFFRITPSCVDGKPVHYSDAYAWGNPGHEKDMSPMLPKIFALMLAHGCV